MGRRGERGDRGGDMERRGIEEGGDIWGEGREGEGRGEIWGEGG